MSPQVVYFCFVDGHVKTIPGIKLLSQRNDGQVIPGY